MKILLRALAPILVSGLGLTTAASVQASSCRCQPGQSCWPSSADLDALGEKLSSPSALLSSIHPPANPCHGSAYSETGCADVQGKWLDLTWRTSQPGATVNPIFEAQTPSSFYVNTTEPLECSPFTSSSKPCGRGQVPSFGVEAASERDVEVALDFARRHNLRVVVKSTGHDLLGRSSGRNTFMIWTRKLDSIKVEDSFTPAGCHAATATPAIRLGAGIQWQDAYNAISSKAGRVLVGGFSANGTVSASGGWVSGAGHSILSPTYGLGIDNALEFRVVVPGSTTKASSSITVSACQNPDLFWAIRGGGGGSFGIITEVVYKTHEESPGLGTVFSASTSSASTHQELLRTLYSAVPTLAHERWGGYSFFVPTPPSNGSFNWTYTSTLLMYRASATNAAAVGSANATMTGLLANLTAIAGANSSKGRSFALPSFASALSVFSQLMSGSSAGSYSETDEDSASSLLFSISEPISVYSINRFLTKDMLQEQSSLNRLADVALSSVVTGNHVGGGILSTLDPHRAAAHPAWASALVEAAINPLNVSSLPEVAKEVFALAGGAHGGAYLNEAGYHDPYWPESFWGSHYQKLASLKSKWDPESQLIVTRGVASEAWSADLACKL